MDPSWFVKEQTSTPSLTVDDNSRLVALQLGNCYGLLFLAAIAVLYTTTELKVVRNYLIALWIADIGHIAVCYVGLGLERFVDVASWNSMTWGNVGATVSGVFFGQSGDCLANRPRDISLPDPDGVSSRFLWSGCSRFEREEDAVRESNPPFISMSADKCRWRPLWLQYYLNVSTTCAPRPLQQLHGCVVKVAQRGHCVLLIDTLRNVIMLACAVAQDPAEVDLENFDNLLVLHGQENCGTWKA